VGSHWESAVALAAEESMLVAAGAVGVSRLRLDAPLVSSSVVGSSSSVREAFARVGSKVGAAVVSLSQSGSGAPSRESSLIFATDPC